MYRKDSSTTVWSASLLLAFDRSLLWVRSRLRPWHDEDLDQHVVFVFLETLHRPLVTNHEAFAAKALADDLKHEVFRGKRKDRKRAIATEPLDDHEASEPLTRDQEKARAILREVLGGVDPADQEMLMSTLGRDEPVSDYVALRHPDAGQKERDKLAAALRKRRNGILRAVRERYRVVAGEVEDQKTTAEQTQNKRRSLPCTD